MRQRVTVGTRHSKVGDPVSAVLLAPIVDGDRVILPAGTELTGVVTMVRKVGLGFKHQTAGLGIAFREVRLADGQRVPIDTKMTRVETAREWVDSAGRVNGIRPVTNASSSLAVAAWRLLVVAPAVGASVWATKLLFAPAPDTEIEFAIGTEYRLELTRPLVVEDADLSSTAAPAKALDHEFLSRTESVIDSLPSQRVQRLSGQSADLVNLVLTGSAENIQRAFQAAGWLTSDPKAAVSVIHSYFSIMLRRGYQNAPMAAMSLDGNRADVELEKSLDSFSKRHHLRMWQRGRNEGGEEVWVAAATEDTGIKFSSQTHNFTHLIDGNVDAERTKVVNDLLYTGCVTEAGIVDRTNLPSNLENGTGTRIITDGRVAVLRIGDCATRRTMPGVGNSSHPTALRRFGASARTELVRSNFVGLAYSGIRLTAATHRFLFGKPAVDDSGAALTRQQLSWLRDGTNR